ncbi:MAG: acetolactate synthase, large subunit, biosynthetic type, partial [Anaerocolumna sp.]|nr:acetolactate synthase, large subunit, biosynthetic type [Anaerocolumna sp.]
MEIKGTELFVKALKEEGVTTLFAYPGGQVIDLFDALYDQEDIEVILPRHEQALVHAADGYARSTGKVGVCLVTSGPGATNLVTGIATANYDSVPLVCFTGQVATSLIGNDAFQEVDIVGITRSICKYAVTVRDRRDLGRIIKEAFYIARTGKPGPVLIDLPKDIQQTFGESEYPNEINIRGYKPMVGVHLGQLRRAMAMIEEAKKPVFLIGGGVNISGAGEELGKLTELTGIPVITTIMGKGAIPTNHPLYVGNIGIHGNYASNMAISECDVLISIGTRFNDRITGKVSEFAKNSKIIHIDIDAASISRNISVDIPIVADAKTAIQKMLIEAKPLEIREWVNCIAGWKKEYPITMNSINGLTPEKIIRKINERYKNSVVVTDVGQNQLWTTQFLELDENRKLLTSGGLGTMGYGLPAAIGAKLGNPLKDVICISGDGGIQMNIQEMATAVALEIPLIICIFNNSYLGNVRQWQELFYKKRYASTCLKYRRSCGRNCGSNECPKYTPNFVKLSESYDALGIRVETEEDIEKAFAMADKNRNAPTIIEFIIDENINVSPMVPGG